jgi:hypothetical protein
MGIRIDIKTILLYLIVFFVLVSIWNNPTTSAHTAGLYLGKVGHFLVVVFERASTFFRGLTTRS